MFSKSSLGELFSEKNYNRRIFCSSLKRYLLHVNLLQNLIMKSVIFYTINFSVAINLWHHRGDVFDQVLLNEETLNTEILYQLSPAEKV